MLLSDSKQFDLIERYANAQGSIDGYLSAVQLLRRHETTEQFKGSQHLRTRKADTHGVIASFFKKNARYAGFYDALAGHTLSLPVAGRGVRVTRNSKSELSRIIAENHGIPESKFTRNLAKKFLGYFDGRLIQKLEEIELIRGPIHH